jgi:hypothetical protein
MAWMFSFSSKGWIAAQRPSAVLGAINQILNPKRGRANSMPPLIDFYIAAKLLNYFPFF